MDKITEGLKIVHRLNSKGFEAYLVGGCVRDTAMKIIPNDVDISTSATPEQVMKIFDNVIPTGIKYGTVTILRDGEKFEITTFRGESKYSDGRRPDAVSFGVSLKEDLSRRDFTINAMAMNINRVIIDPFNGQNDIKSKQIRCVGDAKTRFREDALRMMRAVRFSRRFSFKISDETRVALHMCRKLVQNVSAERYFEEFEKTVKHRGLRHLVETGMCDVWIPELAKTKGFEQFNKYHKYDVLLHTHYSVSHAITSKYGRDIILALVFHDIGKVKTRTIDKDGFGHFYGHPEISAELFSKISGRLKMTRDLSDKIHKLIEYHDKDYTFDDKQIRKLVVNNGVDFVINLLKFKACDASTHINLAKGPSFYKEKARLVKSKNFIQEAKPGRFLAVNGDDLIKIGFKPGKDLGLVLKTLTEEAIENPENNNKETLLKIARNIIVRRL